MAKQYLVEIAAGSIEPGSIPFNLYAPDHTGKLVMICRAGSSSIDKNRMSLVQRGRIYYVASEDMNLYLDYAYNRLARIVSNPMIRVADKSRIVHLTGKRVIRQIFDNPKNSEAIEQARKIVESLVYLITSVPDAADCIFALSASDAYTFSHSINVCILCLLIGAKLIGKEKERLQELGLGGLLHDIGKTQIDPEILFKPDKLTGDEMAQVRRHAEFSRRLIESHGLPEAIQEIGHHHHERSDGSGYPDGLRESDTHPFARIAALADAYDAVTSDRVYSNKISNVQALSELAGQSPLFDSKVLDALLGVVIRNQRLINKFQQRFLKTDKAEGKKKIADLTTEEVSVFDKPSEEGLSASD